mmetsp:Transcript_807/g.1432  ORF Transcript_807/g.1432 Transcript_807/m.1432 type:complete len:533 (+) Transcript_807:278-1876(+)
MASVRPLSKSDSLIRGRMGAHMNGASSSRASVPEFSTPKAPATSEFSAPKEPEKHGELKLWQAYVHVVKGNVGPGCLSMPYAFSQGGLIPSLCIMIVFAPACIYCMLLLVWSKHKMLLDGGARGVSPRQINFEEVGVYALGTMGGKIIEVFVLFTQLGVCSIYFDFCSTNLHAVFPNVEAKVFIILMTPVTMMTVLIRDARGLVVFSTIASFFIVSALLTIYGEVIPHLGGDLYKGPIRMFGQLDRVPLVFGSLAFAFEGIGLILPIESSLAENQRAGFPRVLGIGMTTVAIIFLITGVLCFVALGTVDNASITASLLGVGLGEKVLDLLNMMVCAAVFLTYPLQFLPAAQIVEKKTGQDQTVTAKFRGIAPEGASNEAVALIPTGERALTNAPMAAGTSDTRATEESVRLSINESSTPPPEAPPGCLRSCTWKGRLVPLWILLRMMLVLGTALCAYSLPDLGILITLIGSVCSTTLGLILPPIIHQRLYGDTYSVARYTLHGAVMLIGVVGGSLGFFSAVKDLLASASGER